MIIGNRYTVEDELNKNYLGTMPNIDLEIDEDNNKIELSEEEVKFLINDLISYIWNIKKRVFGDDWNFGTDISEVEELSEDQENLLKSYGYYSRKKLLDKLKDFEREHYTQLTWSCCDLL